MEQLSTCNPGPSQLPSWAESRVLQCGVEIHTKTWPSGLCGVWGTGDRREKRKYQKYGCLTTEMDEKIVLGPAFLFLGQHNTYRAQKLETVQPAHIYPPICAVRKLVRKIVNKL